MRVPAWCPKCDLVFPSGFPLIPGSGNIFRGNLTYCPNCRGPSPIADAIPLADNYFLSGIPDEALQAFFDFIQSDEAQQLSEEDFENRALEIAPAVAPLLAAAKQKRSTFTKGGLLAAALVLMMPGTNSPKYDLKARGTVGGSGDWSVATELHVTNRNESRAESAKDETGITTGALPQKKPDMKQKNKDFASPRRSKPKSVTPSRNPNRKRH